MAKQLNQDRINVNLAFTADTKAAQAQLKQLQDQLQRIINTPATGINAGMTKEIQAATQAAAQLQVQLNKAINQDTGKLDLGKLTENMDLKQVEKYRKQLEAIGPAGKKAFQEFSVAVSNAELPLKRTSKLADNLWTTLKNTARWQLSSSILHGFMGALQSAYGYAQDLNESLNNIRIVTGYSTDEMAKFAAQANKAAKALSTTTTRYTDAALIYYQQGLSDKEILERTETTVKMANVTRQTAEVVSNQLTSIWNNFDDGSKSLEYYADVITELGAATASSSDEIAQGVQKFSAAAETVGLSYEYATSALATVTATTRESADVVGTAFKTLFSRIQGLNLGETLDDGTTLNKYSEALAKVGISIKDQNGGIKEMDTILNEMGAKWSTLGKDQQLALAQTVAGVRQYTQLVALMDNWQYFQENLATAKGATGALEKQQKIYEESWQAASDRVRASLEGIYDTIIDDEAFIDVLNVIDDIVQGVDKLIDSVGGLGGVLSSLGVILTKVLHDKLATGLKDAAYVFSMKTGKGQQKARLFQEGVTEQRKNMDYNDNSKIDQSLKASAEVMGEAQKRFIANQDKMTDDEKALTRIYLDRLKVLSDINTKKAEEYEQLKKSIQLEKVRLRFALKSTGGEKFTKEDEQRLQQINKALEESSSNSGPISVKKAKQMLPDQEIKRDAGNNIDQADYQEKLQEEKRKLEEKQKTSTDQKQKDYNEYVKNLEESTKKADKALQDSAKYIGKTFEDLTEEQKEYLSTYGEINKDTNISDFLEGIVAQEVESADKIAASLIDLGIPEEQVNSLRLRLEQLGASANIAEEGVENLKNEGKSFGANLDDFEGKILGTTDHIVNSAEAIMSLVSIFNMVKGALDALTDPDLSGWEKFTSVMMSLASAIPMVTTLLKNESVQQLKSAAATTIKTKAAEIQTAKTIANTGAVSANTSALWANVAATWALYWPILLIAGAIAAFVIVINKSKKAQEESAKATERLATVTEELGNASEEAAQKVNSLKDAYNNYQTAINTIETLKKGTEEYAKAMQDANDAALDLLSTYPELAKEQGILSGGPGNYRINEDVFNAYLDQQEQLARGAKLAYMQSQAQLGAQQDEDQISQSLNNFVQKGYERNNGKAYVAGEYGEVDLLGDFAVKVWEDRDNLQKQSKEDLEQYTRNYLASSKLITSANETLTGDLKDFTSYVVESSDIFNDIAQTSTEIANQLSTASKIMADYILGEDQLEGQSDEWREVYDRERDEALKELESKQFTKQTTINDKILQDLIEDAGVTKAVSKSQAIVEKDGMFYLQFEDGSQQTIQSLQSIAASNIASQAATKEIVQTGKNSTYGKLQEYDIILDENTDAALANSLLDRVENLTGENKEEIISQLANEINNTDAQGQNALISDFIDYNAEKVINLKEQAEQYGLAEESVEQYAKSLTELGGISKNVDKNLNGNIQAAENVAIANSRMNKGLLDLAENFEDYRYILDKSDEGTAEHAEALSNIASAMKDVLGLDDVELSDSFLTLPENLDLISKAATGDVKAIEELRQAAAQDIIANIKFEDDYHGDILKSALDRMQDKLNQQDLKIGASIDLSEVSPSLNAFIKDAKMTTEQVQDYFNALGYTPEISGTESVPQTVTRTGSIEWADGRVESYTQTDTSYVEVPIIKSLTYHGSAGATVNTGAINKASSGSTKKPSDTKLTKKSDVVDRYKEYDDSLDDLNDALDDANKKTDRLFGVNRIKSMQEESNLLNDQVDLLKQKGTKAKQYQQDDKKALEEKAKELANMNIEGFGEFQFDADGDISNYTTQMEALYKELHEKELHLQSIKSAEAYDAFKESTVQPLQDKINELKDLISQYDDSKELAEELQNQIDDAYYAWQDKNYEILTYELELDIQINDDELKRLDFLLGAYEGDIFKAAERAALISGKDGQIDVTKNSLDLAAAMLGSQSVDGTWDTNGGTLAQMYANKEISSEKYIEGLRANRDAVYDNLNALLEYDKIMKAFYGETIQQGQDELSKYTDRMNHSSEVLDHYINLMGILGKEKDYDAMGNLLQGQANLAEDRLQVAQENYNMLEAQRKDIEAKLTEAETNGDQAMIDFYKQQWVDISEATEEAQNEMLSATETWAESMKAVIENNMQKAADALEKALTNNRGFDTIMTEFDRLNTRQEEYFTDTNKIYETNKMMRNIDKQIDSTSNKASKQRLANFKSEVQGLQDKNQLSKFELEIQQAKYDLLLAEIALEEAQNAKSTVRLSRDSEGNFGYVYTADQDKIDDAMQEVEDKENALYNVSLEGQQEYTEKYLQAQQQMYDELTALEQAYLNGDIASDEEYQTRKQEILNHYYGENGILRTYSNLYNIAVQGHSKATADYWAKDYGAMTQKTDEWKTSVNGYILEVEGQIGSWKETSTKANEIVQGALGDTKKATEDLTKANDELLKKLIGDNGLIKKLGDEATAAKGVTDEYITQKEKVDDLVESYTDLIREIDAAIKKQAEFKTKDQSAQTPQIDPPKDPGNDNPANDPDGQAPSGGVTNSNYDNQGYSDADVIRAQKFVGAEADGKWGNNSNNAAKAKGYDGLVSVMNALNSIGNAALFTSSFNGYIYSNPNYQSGKSQPDGYGGVVYEGAIKVPSGSGGFVIKDLYNDKVLIANEQGLEGWINKRALSGFKTGGYTGEWGSEGKLAFLHQKELVLNEGDTDNLLKTISFIRELVSMIDIQAAGASLVAMSAIGAHPIGGQKLEQQVSIQAEFPNVTDRYEIEEAFNSLVNRASQYANRKF